MQMSLFCSVLFPVENVPLKDCAALYKAGYKAPGKYLIDPTGMGELNVAVHAHCDEGWTDILERGNGPGAANPDDIIVSPA